ncbi:MAG TPA: lytic transglycosylase domain-containing protein [Vicinamibacteria bacterium]
MTQRMAYALAAILGLAALLPLLAVTAALTDPERRRPVAPAATASPVARGEPPLAARPVEEWTARIRALQTAGDWERLDDELDALAQRRRDLYDGFDLRYLHARAAAEAGNEDEARDKLRPYLVEGHPLRDLALFHLSEAAAAAGDEEEAARLREQLLFSFGAPAHREEAVADHLAWLAARGDPQRLLAFGDRLGGPAAAEVRRQASARAVEILVAQGQPGAAAARGLALIRERETDDAADRAFRALDRREVLDTLTAEDWRALGETARHHRRFDRASVLLRRALPQLPARREDLLFSIGRAHFGAEQFAEAEQAYLQGTRSADDAEARLNFLYHAARAALLQGQDARAEAHLTRAIALGAARPAPAPRRRGRRARAPAASPRLAVALTQRLRIRAAARRWAPAGEDLAALRRAFPDGTGWVDATVALASAEVVAGRTAAALAALRALPSRLLAGHDGAEVGYWTARALEPSDPPAALDAYLRVLRADVPTHFAYLARRRLLAEPFRARARTLMQEREAEAERRMAAGDQGAARSAQTDAVLLASPEALGPALERLRRIYRELPAYRDVLDLAPFALPTLAELRAFALAPSPAPSPSASPGSAPSPGAAPAAFRRFDLLLALGLFDDAADEAPERYPMGPPISGLTRAVVLNQAGATRGSIQAVENLMASVPDDYVPELLPASVRQLLYPRYFYSFVVEDARRHGADPRLVIAIMREESRFDPRARSMAAARGLLQFIITTAREVGRSLGLMDLSAEDLYDPRVVIQLGAKYVGDLLREFSGNRYRAVAAYNAGPAQARLWTRMAPGGEDDAYLSAINFDETRNYVRKVMNSYERYGQIYEGGGPVGGVEAQP